MKTDNGYIRVSRGGKLHMLHRYLFEQANGKIPDNMVVRHKCDNPSCINLEHLEVGTQADNNRDTRERGRYSNGIQKGKENGNSRLSDEDVREIKCDTVSTNKALAEKYGVHHSTISLIRLGKIWSHIN
jgi:hypothetical protein